MHYILDLRNNPKKNRDLLIYMVVCFYGKYDLAYITKADRMQSNCIIGHY